MNKVVMQVSSLKEIIDLKHPESEVYLMPALFPGESVPYKKPGFLFHLIAERGSVSAIEFVCYSVFLEKSKIPEGLKTKEIERYFKKQVCLLDRFTNFRKVYFHNLVLPSTTDADEFDISVLSKEVAP